jgi:sodium-dependent dicarboxylate transporter 2/3/5
MPTPASLVKVVDEYGAAKVMMKAGIASNPVEAANKAKIVLGIVPMAAIFFCTEAMPIGLVGILMPLLAYFFKLLPRDDIGKSFCGDAPLFLLGVLGMGAVITEVGLHKRFANWAFGWVNGFKLPIFVLALSSAIVGSFISAHAVAAFMTPVIVIIYFGAVRGKDESLPVTHDPALAKLLLFTFCFALNVGGVGSPAAGGRNSIMMGFFSEYNVPMSFIQWMYYGFPLVPILGVIVAVYMLVFFRKTRVKDLTPGLEVVRQEIKKMGPMKFNEKAVLTMVIGILILWAVGGESFGLGGPALLALFIPVLLKIVDWKEMLADLSWNAWFMYCGAMTLGSLLKTSGAALWLATTFLDGMRHIGADSDTSLLIGTALFSGYLTNFMSDAAVTALLGPITLPMGIFSGGAGQPWTIGLVTAFATSFALWLIVGTPNNAIIYALAIYPDSKKRIIHPLDFVKYGFLLWVICMLVLVVVCIIYSHGLVSFPPEITEKARAALEAMKTTGPAK